MVTDSFLSMEPKLSVMPWNTVVVVKRHEIQWGESTCEQLIMASFGSTLTSWASVARKPSTSDIVTVFGPQFRIEVVANGTSREQKTYV